MKIKNLPILLILIVLFLISCKSGIKQKTPESLFKPVDGTEYPEKARAIDIAKKEAIKLSYKLEEMNIKIKDDRGNFTIAFSPKTITPTKITLGGSCYIYVEGKTGKITSIVHGQ
jgi:hypothetical protein